MVHLLMPIFADVLQLAMNYTTTTVTVQTNSTTVYNTTNSTAADYTNQQLSRVVGETRLQLLSALHITAAAILTTALRHTHCWWFIVSSGCGTVCIDTVRL